MIEFQEGRNFKGAEFERIFKGFNPNLARGFLIHFFLK